MVSKRLFQIFEISVFFAVIATQLYLSQRGLYFNDTLWYYNDPYLLATGGVPFVDVISQAPGFGIIPAIFYKLFMWITGSTNGLYLFSRWLYVFWNAIIALITFYIAKKYLSFKIPFLAICAFISFVPNAAFAINYNNIGITFFPLICALVFADHENRLGKSKIFGFFAGLVASLTVLGTPMTLIALFVLLLYLITQEKWDRITGIFWGIFTSVVLLVTYCCSLRGIKAFINGLYMFFHDNGYVNVTPAQPIGTSTSLFLYYYGFFAASIILLTFFKKILKNQPKKFFLLLNFFILASFIMGILFLYLSKAFSFNYIWPWFGALLYNIFTHHQKRHYSLEAVFTINIALILSHVISSFLSIDGFVDRHHWLTINSIITLCVLYNENLFQKKQKWVILSLSLLFFTSIFHLLYPLSSILSLNETFNTSYPKSFFKGVLASENRAKAFLKLENYLSSNIKEEDCVYFLELAPPLISEKKMHFLQKNSADSFLQFFYDKNTIIPLYNYWSHQNKIPTKIIFVIGQIIWSKAECDVTIRAFLDPKSKLQEFLKKYYYPYTIYKTNDFQIYTYTLKDPIGAMQEAHDLATIPFKRALNHNR